MVAEFPGRAHGEAWPHTISVWSLLVGRRGVSHTLKDGCFVWLGC